MGICIFKEYEWKPGSNTVAYYPLEKDALDYSGNNRNGTDNGVTFSNNVGVFNGSSNITLGTDNWTKFQTYSNGTISVWFKFTKNPVSGANNYVIGKARMHPNTQSNILYGIGINDAKKLVAGVFPGNSWSPVPVPYGSSINIDLNLWYNVVLTKTGTTKNVYINGSLAATQTAQDTTSTDNPPLTIGSVTYNNSNSYMTGNISQVIIEDKARTATEIQMYYDRSKSLYGLS